MLLLGVKLWNWRPLLHNVVFCLLRLADSRDYFILACDVMYMYIDKFHRHVLSPCSPAKMMAVARFSEKLLHIDQAA